MLTNLRNGTIVAIFVGIIATLAVLGIRSVLELKTGRNGDDSEMITIQSEGDVVGLKGVPAYPGSTFMYEDDIGTDVVQQFLSKGASAYLLPSGTDWEEVAAFYSDELPSEGWEHVLSVSLGDEDRRNGEFWVYYAYVIDPAAGEPTEEIDELRSYGLRIYSKYSSVWYEKITVTQAQNGLADEVAEEKEIELLLAMGSMEELPDTFPWALSYPEMWDVDIREASLVEAPLAEFTSPEADGPVIIEPVAFDIGSPLSAEAEEFIAEINSRRSEEDVFDVVGTEEMKVAGLPALRYTLSSEGGTGMMVFVVHPDNGIVYVVTALSGDEAVLNYIVENLESEHEEKD